MHDKDAVRCLAVDLSAVFLPFACFLLLTNRSRDKMYAKHAHAKSKGFFNREWSEEIVLNRTKLDLKIRVQDCTEYTNTIRQTLRYSGTLVLYNIGKNKEQ